MSRQADILAYFLKRKEIEWAQKELENNQNADTTQGRFAIWLGIAPTTYSDLRNGRRLPSYENLDLMAAKLGPQAYEAAGLPPRLPNDRRLRFIAAHWHKLTA